MRATALGWFNAHRQAVLPSIDVALLGEVDTGYQDILSYADRSALRTRYKSRIRQLRESLLSLRTTVAIPRIAHPAAATSDAPPDFSPLVPDAAAQDAIRRRWVECAKCVSAEAPLAATVMMGGVLEALLLARINLEANKTRVFTSQSAPKDKRTGKTLLLRDWLLRNYIDVAHELGWVTRSAKDIGEVLRDYRNYIHPYKELAHGVVLQPADARLFWDITKGLALQVVQSV